MTEITKILDQIEARAKNAPDGPWSTGGYFNPGRENETQNVWGPTPEGCQSGEILASDCKTSNARFLAAARSDVPALVQALRLAVNEIKEAQGIFFGEGRVMLGKRFDNAFNDIAAILSHHV